MKSVLPPDSAAFGSFEMFKRALKGWTDLPMEQVSKDDGCLAATKASGGKTVERLLEKCSASGKDVVQQIPWLTPG